MENKPLNHIHVDSGKYANMTMLEILEKLENGDQEALQYLQQFKGKLEEVENAARLSTPHI